MKLFPLVTSSLLLTSTFTQFAFAATANTADPTATQVGQTLINFYQAQKVWPFHLQSFDANSQNNPNFYGTPSQGGEWDTNINDWIGLKTVFPSQPASALAKDLGMNNTPADKSITAGTLAQWIMNWEKDARNIHLKTPNGHMLFPTTSSYQLMQLYSIFYHTNITSPKTVITFHDLQQVILNLRDVNQGYRLLATDQIELLEPLFGDQSLATFSHYYSPSVMAAALREFDSVTLTFLKNGNVIYNRANYDGMVMERGFDFVRNNKVTNAYVLGSFETINKQLSGKVPLTMMPYSNSNFGQDGLGPNSLNYKRQPYNGTFFYIHFSGPQNRYTLASKNGATVMSTPQYWIQIQNGLVKNVIYNNEMNSYPFQVMG